jgi:transcription elongation factor GreA
MNLSRKQLPTYHFTAEGFEKIKKEESDLKVARVEAVRQLSEARAMGDLSENGYYKAAREKLSSIDSRLRRVALLLKYGKVVESLEKDVVGFGSRVKVKTGNNTREFLIVGKEEANPEENKLSNVSPIGRALIGRKIGEVVDVETIRGILKFEILKIE